MSKVSSGLNTLADGQAPRMTLVDGLILSALWSQYPR